MAVEQKWLLAGAIVAIFAVAAGGTAGGFIALPLGGAGLLLWFVYHAEAVRSGRGFAFHGSRFLIASICVGAAYLFVMQGLAPPSGPVNLIWFIGLPAASGAMLLRRPLGLALSVPLALVGFIWVYLASAIFHLPLD